MNAKEYLQQAYRIDVKIKDKNLELENLRELSTSVSSPTITDNGGASKSTKPDKVGRIVGRIVDLEREIKSEINRYFDLKSEINEKINLVADETLQSLLFKRYILCQSWKYIAVDMGYTYRHTLLLHSNALKEFSKTYH